MRKILATLALLLGALHILSAVPAYPGKVKVTQPDGSVLTIRIHGDEWFHYATDERGRVVARAADGFWREATSAERRRIVELLVAEAVLREDGLELVLQCEEIKSIMEEIENESDQN